MSGVLVRLKLPLLGKELVEQAARKRTYWVRVVYAVLLFGLFLVEVRDVSHSMGVGYQNAFGRGRDMYFLLIVMQAIGIILFLPGMMASAIAEEKERGSLALLFLTDLRPWELVVQKYLGRLIPAFTFLLLSLPMLAICYAFGGLSRDLLLSGFYSLVVMCLFVGALALLCSAWVRTTAGAFLLAYGLVIGLYVISIIYLIEAARHGRTSPPVLWVPFPSWILPWAGNVTFRGTLSDSIPALGLTLALLGLATACLPRRAFVPARYRLRECFHKLDRWFAGADQRFGGIVLSRPSTELPELSPVAWRETRKRSTGKVAHLSRLCLLISLPTTFVGLFTTISNMGSTSEILTIMILCTWVVVPVILVIQGANAVATERAEQTLEVLLSTPLRATDIVREKMRGLRRLMFVLTVPLTILTLIRAFLGSRLFDGENLSYLIVALYCLATYLPLATWLGMWIGLRSRSQTRVSMVALATLVGWCVVPVLVTFVLSAITNDDNWAWLALSSPATGVALSETWEWNHFPGGGSGWGPMIVNFCFHGVVLYSLRRRCLRHADQYLRGELSSR